MLELQNVSAFYGDSLALNGISLRVPPRQGVAILGRNGAGKSTLFKSIVRGGPSVRGDILLDGQSLIRRAPHERDSCSVGSPERRPGTSPWRGLPITCEFATSGNPVPGGPVPHATEAVPCGRGRRLPRSTGGRW